MEGMEKISRFIISGCLCVLFLLFLQSCKSHDFFHQVAKNRKYTNKLYKKYLKTYGNASWIDPESTFSVLWYYDNNKIHITRIRRAKIMSTSVYDCEPNSVINIREYKKGCYMECIDADGFESSFYDTETDSLYRINVCLDIDELISKETDCPVLKELREYIIKYKLWERSSWENEDGKTCKR